MGGTKKTSKPAKTKKAKPRAAKSAKPEAGELGDDELERVAGGVTVKYLSFDGVATADKTNQHIEVESFSWGVAPLQKDLIAPLQKELSVRKK